MALPAGILSVTVKGRYRHPDGTPYEGTVSFFAPGIIQLADADTVVTGTASAGLDANGEFSLTLVATDNPNMSPVAGSWVYTVTEVFSGGVPGRTYSLDLPSTTPVVEISDSAPSDPATPNYVPVIGPQGPRGNATLGGPRPPLGTDGIDGDFWINNTNPNALFFYGPKAAGTWPSGQLMASTPIGPAGGDLGGTYPNPTVAKISGASVSGTPAAGKVMAATSNSAASWRYALDWLDIRNFGAVGNGVADCYPAIQAAVDAAAAAGGGTVYVPYGAWAVSATIEHKSRVTIRGPHGVGWPFRLPQNTATILPTAGFVGECVISMRGADITGSADNEGGMRLLDLNLSGENLPGAGSVSGIHAQGEVLDVVLRNLSIKKMTHNGIHTNIGAGTKGPHDWFVDTVVCYSNALYGFSLQMTDGYIRNSIASSNGMDGWFLGPIAGLTMEGPQALWNTGRGFTIAGGSTAGNLVLTGVLTDRNGKEGIYFGPSSGAGAPPILLNGATLYRDGRNNKLGGGGYAGLRVDGLANPLTVTGLIVHVGVDDDTTGAASPQFAGRFNGNAYVSVVSGYLHGVTAGWQDDGNNTVLRRGINIAEATGPAATPTLVYGAGVTTYGTSLDVPGNTVGVPTPRNHGGIAWSVDPRAVRSEKAVVNGTLYLAEFFVPRAATATKLFWGINTAGVAPVAGQNWVAIINSAGLVVATVDVTSRVTSTGPFMETINVPLVPGAAYWAAFLFNATTPPRLYVGSDLHSGLLNINLGAANLAFATAGTGLTAMPASITPASNIPSQHCLFAMAA